MDAQFTVPEPANEPVGSYAPGSPERASLQRRLAELAAERLDLTMTIDGVQRMGAGPSMPTKAEVANRPPRTEQNGQPRSRHRHPRRVPPRSPRAGPRRPS